MASIKERTGKSGTSYQVRIHKRGHDPLTATFSDYETAVLWAKYKEMLIDEMVAFDPNTGDTLTVEQAILIKYGKKSKEYNSAAVHLTPIFDRYVDSLTFDELKELAMKSLNTPVQKKHNSKSMDYPAKMTVLRKFAYLSAAINHLRLKGHTIKNEAIEVVAFLRNLEETTEVVPCS